MAKTNADPKKVHISLQWKHSSPLIACCFDPKGRFVFTSGEDYQLQRWEIPSGKKVAWPAHESWIRDIVFLPDGETMITAGCDDKLIYWPTAAAKPKPIRTVEAHKGWIRSLCVSADGKTFISGGNDGLVKLWNASDGKLIRQFSGHKFDIYSTCLHPNGKTLFSGDQGGQIREWDIATGKSLRSFDAKVLLTNNTQGVRYGGVRGLAVSPDGKYLAACGLHKATNPLGAVNEPVALLFNMKDQKKVRSHVANGVKGIAWQLAWLNDGTLAVASGGSGGGFLLFWRPDNDKEFHRLKLPDTARDMSLHPDGLQLATVHYDRHVRISKLTAKPAAKKKPPAKKKK
ncbi:MAG: WD40 repeat domain-containing protein [Planctomycetaceae bacterium]|jgi:WD40 repeat protein|nr:WD40 repeat domain-containing protein [Planctomycetaceae bacterium]